MTFKYRAQVTDGFAAAHSLRGSAGLCARNHGHNWGVTVVVEADALDDRGMVVDFLDLQTELRQILDRYEHQDLNEIPPFDRERNPTAENVAREIAMLLAPKIGPQARLVEVQLSETSNMTVVCRIVRDEAGT